MTKSPLPPNRDSELPSYEDDDEGTAILSMKGIPLPAVDREPQPFLVFLGGGRAGRMVRVEAELTLGRSPRASVQVDGEGVSRKHARIFRQGGETFVEDLGSTNGTRVNGEPVVGAARLQDGDKIQLGATTLLKFSLQDELDQQFQKELFEAALRDPLTKAYNRRALLDRLGSDLAHARRHADPYVLILLDLDHFKRINDDYGHLAGDFVLRRFAEIVTQLTRREDFFARYGGEEFALACRSTSLEQGLQLAERVRARVEAEAFVFQEQRMPVTLSAGVALHWAEAEIEALIGAADVALYAAKERGRNRVESGTRPTR